MLLGPSIFENRSSISKFQKNRSRMSKFQKNRSRVSKFQKTAVAPQNSKQINETSGKIQELQRLKAKLRGYKQNYEAKGKIISPLLKVLLGLNYRLLE